MVEIEIKLQVPVSRRDAVAREVAGRGAGAASLRLQAAYFDTAERALASAGLAWRVRREGRRWVQTLKGAGADGITRFEHNVPRPGPAAPLPVPDAALHAATPVGARLIDVLKSIEGAPVCVFRTDIRRRARTLRVAAGGSVELAFDEGTIAAGTQRLPVRELEIELVAGTPAALIATARRWTARHGLWIDVRSKAERGDLLARGEALAPARKAAPVALAAAMDLAEGRRAVLRSCLDQVIVNASQVAEGRFADEHVHQLRVGLRRLRTALRLFDGLAAPAPDEAAAALAAAAAALFRQLGAARDRAAVGGPLQVELQRALEGIGLDLQAPTLPPAADAVEPAAALRAPAAQGLLLDLLAAVQPEEAGAAAAEAPPLRAALARRLNRWHKQVAADAPRFAELDDTARHALRKRAKRLRYAVEFSAALFGERAVRRYLAPLRELQERLGALNDVAVGLAGFREASGDDPRALFALGWLAARRERLLAECAPALRAVAKAKRFWK
jgi:inorganic triphosphatase YgiF